MIERACPHRGTDLAFGRLEAGGLRCAFHGWLFDVEASAWRRRRAGRQPDVRRHPAEGLPGGGAKRHPVRLSGTLRTAGVSALRLLYGPDTHTFAFKGMIDCNWLQSLEVASTPRTPRSCTASSTTRIPAGLRQAVPRQLDRFRHADDPDHARVSSPADRRRADRLRHAHPHHAADQRRLARMCASPTWCPGRLPILMSSEMTITQWHVPIDDARHYWYAIFTSFERPGEQGGDAASGWLYELPDYIPRKNRSNDYGFDPHEQEYETFHGHGCGHQRARSVGVRIDGGNPGPHQGASGSVRQGDQRLSSHSARRDSPRGRHVQAADGARSRRRGENHRSRRDRRHRAD